MTVKMLSDADLTQESISSPPRPEKERVIAICSDHRILLTHVAVFGLGFAAIIIGILS
jgi:hypothetical protein